MENIIANVDDIIFDIEIQIENQLFASPLPFPRMDKGEAPICKLFMAGTFCKLGELCPFRHIRDDKTVVCKHWLKGLCKKSDDCEFLHKYDLEKMPECFFFSKYQQCHNANCKFKHVNPEEKKKTCAWYERGFCRNGPYCRHRHVKKILCPNYLAGFCPLGPNCKNAHPRHNIPIPADSKEHKKTGILMCTYCGNTGHNASHCFKMKQANLATQTSQIATTSETKFQKTLGEVTCFKCGEKGHYANRCVNGVQKVY